MRLLSNVLLLAGALITSAPTLSAHEIHGDLELILFGANWCAPCRAELAEVQQLAAALGQHRLTVAWVDGTPPLGPSPVPANARILDRRAAQALFLRFTEINAGLPLAVMRDGHGGICAVIKERVHVTKLVALRQKCEARLAE